MNRIIKRALLDTYNQMGGVGWIVAIIPIPFVGFFLHTVIDGFPAMMPELRAWIIYGLAATIVVLGVLFLVNLSAAPYRIERDLHKETAKDLANLREGTKLDAPIVKSLEGYQFTAEQLQERLFFISAFMRQFDRLLEARSVQRAHLAKDAAEVELQEIAEFIVSEARKSLPELPHQPNNGLAVQIEWNTFRLIFGSLKNRPPEISMKKPDNELEMSVGHTTSFYADIKFFHIPSNNRDAVSLPELCLDAEL